MRVGPVAIPDKFSVRVAPASLHHFPDATPGAGEPSGREASLGKSYQGNSVVPELTTEKFEHSIASNLAICLPCPRDRPSGGT